MDSATRLLPQVVKELSRLHLVLLFIAPFVLTYCITSIRAQISIRHGRPPTVPYFIPFLGNLFSFGWDTRNFLTKCRSTYGIRSIPVAVNLAGSRLYLLLTPSLIGPFFKASRDTDTAAVQAFILKNTFGFPEKDYNSFAADDSGVANQPRPGCRNSEDPERRVWYRNHKLSQTYMAGAKGLAMLTSEFVLKLETEVARRDILGDGVEGAAWAELGLGQWMRDVMTTASIRAMCGPYLLDRYPTFVQDFWKFDSYLPNLFKGVPQWLIPRAWNIRRRLHARLLDWHRYAASNFDWAVNDSNSEWEPFFGSQLMRERYKNAASTDLLTLEGHAADDLGMLWGANANIVPASCWALYDIVRRPELLAEVRRLISTAIVPSDDPSKPLELSMPILTSIPLLQSIYAETLRLRVATMPTRVPVVDNFQLGEWTFTKGDMIVASHYHASRDPEVWNEGAHGEHPIEEFWAERFLKFDDDDASGPRRQPGRGKPEGAPVKSEELKSKVASEGAFTLDGLANNWIPYGGGLKICPGRFFAKNEMLAAVSIVLMNFDIEILPGQKPPECNPAYFPFGAMPWKGEVRVRVRRRDPRAL